MVFDFIHELAIVGTTALLMALGSIWYADAVFGRRWRAALGRTAEDSVPVLTWQRLALTAVSYALALSVLSLVLAAATLVGIGVLEALAATVVFYAALAAGPVIWEGRSLEYYAISTGFAAMCIIVGGVTLTYWPW